MEKLGTVISKLTSRFAGTTTDSTQSDTSENMFECNECRDTGTILVEDKGAKLCDCIRRQIEAYALSRIPTAFGVPDLWTIEAHPELHPEQQNVIDLLRMEPEASYLFCGNNGTGKTFFSYALYVAALRRGNHVVALSTRDLLQQYRACEIERDRAPAEVTPYDLEHSTQKWTIVLDEFEKARATEFTSEMLYALLDAAWKHEHQVVVTTNLPVNQLIERWGKIDEVYGKSMAMRLASACIGVGLW